MAVYLALKEVWRSRGRFLLIAMIVALITTLVLFIAALYRGWRRQTANTSRS